MFSTFYKNGLYLKNIILIKYETFDWCSMKIIENHENVEHIDI